MMQKGLLDDEYRAYIDEQRQRAEQSTPASYAPYTEWDAAVYATLFTLGLVTGGYYDTALDIGADAGGAASLR